MDDWVLVLLPSSITKIKTEWKGPYKVVETIGKTTYRLQIGPRQFQSYHINLLKTWLGPPPVTTYLAHPATPRECTLEQLVVNDQLSPSQKNTLLDIFLSHTSLFSDRPGLTTLVEHCIETPPNQVVRLRPYRIPAARREAVAQEIREMLKMGIIRPSQSDWSSPIALVPKPDGSIRFCIDFRQVNVVSTLDAYPLPRVNELIERLGDAQYISTLDLTKGYWQVPLREADQKKTSFSTPEGLFEFTVLPFGLHGAPTTFQRLMNKVLGPLQAFASTYLDDIVIFSPTWEQHIHHCQQVFQALGQAGLCINSKKSRLGFSKVKYLGYIIGNGCIEPQQEKIKAIKDAPLPQIKKEVRAFLGPLGYYRRFIPHYSALATPLTDLLKKGVPNHCLTSPSTSVCNAVHDLKDAITQVPVLRAPDFSQPFLLQTDDSDVGLGAVLSQVSSDGEEHPILFISRKLFPQEVHYPVVEKECLAVKWAIEKLRYYLEGRPFVLYTDHAPLTWMARNKGNNPRVMRWFLSLQPFSFELRHRKGALNTNADFLSRFPIILEREDSGGGMCQGLLPSAMDSRSSLQQSHPLSSFQHPGSSVYMKTQDQSQEAA